MNVYSPTAATDATCDLRSDTVTRPTPAMRRAMAEAAVGDDVYGEDPTVTRLEAMTAEVTGKEAGLFLPTGTMSNLAGVLSHCGRGDEIVIGHGYHVQKYEAAGASVLGGVAIYPIPVAADGAVEAADVLGAVKDDDFHFATTRLLCLENTHNGAPVPLARMRAAGEAARSRGLGVHLDGARLFNAALALGGDVAAVCAPADTVSVCLSKGLGAPSGSVLVGPADLIVRARRMRKMLGGGMRQSGVLAAAGIVALTEGAARLQEDHDRAEMLAAEIGALGIGRAEARTNMVWWSPDAAISDAQARLAAHGVKVGGGSPVRMVLHHDVDDAGLRAAVDAFRAAFA